MRRLRARLQQPAGFANRVLPAGAGTAQFCNAHHPRRKGAEEPRQGVELCERSDYRSPTRQAIAERARIYEENNHREIDETWAVFDKDDLDQTPGNKQNYESAFILAGEQEVKLAYSNECFELWLLLHFVAVDPTLPIQRKDLYKMLEVAVNASLPEGEDAFNYEHGASDIVKYVSKYGDESAAITRAVSLQEYHKSLLHTPIDSNPVTYVDTLVKSLREWYRYYSYDN